MPRHLLLLLFLLVSAARAADEISVERDADALIVRSPITEANFLFRAPSEFQQAEPEEGFVVDLKAEGGRIRLRLGQLTAGQARAGLDALVQANEKEYAAGYGAPLKVTGSGARRVATVEGKPGIRKVLVVVDGPRLYELFLDAAAGKKELAAALRDVAVGFTILDPKGAPIRQATGDLKAEEIEHDYYRIKLTKPEGFVRQQVDPEQDKGIFLFLRREDENKNRCDIHVRVFLARALKKSTDDKAKARLAQFRQKYPTARGPKRPKRTGFPGASEAYKFKLVGKAARAGLVVEEEWRIVQHDNGRVYEFQVTTYGGAARMWKKEIASFWKSLKIRK